MDKGVATFTKQKCFQPPMFYLTYMNYGPSVRSGWQNIGYKWNKTYQNRTEPLLINKDISKINQMGGRMVTSEIGK